MVRGFPRGSREFPTDPARMPIPPEQAILALHVHREGRAYLERYAGLAGVGVGHKLVRGRSTGQYCVTFLVERKRRDEALDRGQRLPSTVRVGRREFPTDVIHVGGKLASRQRRRNQREQQPRLRGGISIGPDVPRPVGVPTRLTVGTLTGVFKPLSGGQRRYFVTNHHVVDDDVGSTQDGQVMTQPGGEDTTGAPNEITFLGDVDRVIPISIAVFNPQTGFNFVDFAKGRLRPPLRTANGLTVTLGRNEVLRAPDLRGFVWPVPGIPLVKAGRTTGTTWGVLVVAHMVAAVFYGGAGPYIFMDQCIALLDTEAGDSGSPVSSGGLFAGLHFAGYGRFSIFNPFYWVFLLGEVRT